MNPEKMGGYSLPEIENNKIRSSLYRIIFKLNDISSFFYNRVVFLRKKDSSRLLTNLSDSLSQELNKTAHPERKELPFPDWFFYFISSRKREEKNIIQLENEIQHIFYSVKDMVDGLKEFHEIEFSADELKPEGKIPPNIKILRAFLHIKLKFLGLLGKKAYMKIKIPYKKTAQSILSAEIAAEIRKTLNLFFAQRLNFYKRLETLYISYFKNWDERNITDDNSIVIKELDRFYGEEENLLREIHSRFQYALSVPFNHFAEYLEKIRHFKISPYTKPATPGRGSWEHHFEASRLDLRRWLNYYQGFLSNLELKARKDRIILSLDYKFKEIIVILLEDIHGFQDKLKEFRTELTLAAPEKAIKTLKELLIIIQNKLEKKHPNEGFSENIKDHVISMISDIPELMETTMDKTREYKGLPPKETRLVTIELKRSWGDFLLKRTPRVNKHLLSVHNEHFFLMKNKFLNLRAILKYHLDLIRRDKDEGKNVTEILNELLIKLETKEKEWANIYHNEVEKLNTSLKEELKGIESELDQTFTPRSFPIDFKELKKHDYDFSLVKVYAQTKRNSIYNRIKSFSHPEKQIKKSVQYIIKLKHAFRKRLKNKTASRNMNIHLNKLPPIYRPLFDNQALTAFEISSSLDSLHKIIQTELNTGKNILFYGPPGSGKKTLAHYLHSVMKYNENIGLILPKDRIVSSRTFKQKYSSQLERPVIFISQLELLFFKSLSGGEIIDFIMKEIRKGDKQWIVITNSFFYDFIKESFSFSALFQRRIDLRNYYKKLIPNILNKRLEASGIKLRDKKQLKRASSHQGVHTIEEEKHFLDNIAEKSQGTISSALYYFLISTVKQKDDIILIRSPQVQPTPTLSNDALNLLYHIILLGELTEQEIKELYLIDFQKTNGLIQELSSCFFLKTTHEENTITYQFNSFFTGEAFKILKDFII